MLPLNKHWKIGHKQSRVCPIPHSQLFTAEKMTRQKWTTPEQEAWLEERKPDFLLTNQTKSAAKTFYPDLVKEFRDKWPVPAVTQAEIDDAGSIELATRAKRDKYDKVRTCPFMNEI